MLRRMFFTVLPLALLSAPAWAQTSAGLNEVALSGSYTNSKFDQGGRDELTTIQAEFGHFFTKELELGALGGFSHTPDLNVFDVGGKGRFHFFTESRFVPYLGGQVTWSYIDPDQGDSANGLGFGPLGGIKIFVTENVSIFGEYQFRWFTGDLDDSLNDQQVILIGISFFF